MLSYMSVVKVRQTPHHPFDTRPNWRFAINRNCRINIGRSLDTPNGVFDTVFETGVRNPATEFFVQTAKKCPRVFTGRRTTLSLGLYFGDYLFEVVASD